MKNFLAIYIGSEKSANAAKWEALDDKTREARVQEGMKEWGSWVMKNQSSIVEMGGPVGVTKRIGPQGVVDTNNAVTAYTVVRAESHEAAAALFKNHPHFAIFPGDSVEVMEVLPIPSE